MVRGAGVARCAPPAAAEAADGDMEETSDLSSGSGEMPGIPVPASAPIRAATNVVASE